MVKIIDDIILHNSIEFRTIASLTPEEKNILMGLTVKPDGKRSLFQQWLRHPNPQGMYAALVRGNDKIVAWAAVSTHEGVTEKLGIVGVFVSPEYRGKGVAHQALDALLGCLSDIKEDNDRPDYLHYNSGLERLFRPVIESNGFKDTYRK